MTPQQAPRPPPPPPVTDTLTFVIPVGIVKVPLEVNTCPPLPINAVLCDEESPNDTDPAPKTDVAMSIAPF
jgi:hypothetical protein